MPRGVPLSVEQRERVRLRIFRAAARLFLHQGFHETSMRQVADAAGMGKSTIYDYFSDKEEILLYFIDRYMAENHRKAAGIASQNLPAPAKLRRILRTLWAYLADNRGVAVLIAREASRLSEQATRRLARSRLEYRHVLEAVIRQGIREGSLRRIDAALASAALHSLMTMPFYDWLLETGDDQPQRRAEALIDLFLRGAEAPR